MLFSIVPQFLKHRAKFCFGCLYAPSHVARDHGIGPRGCVLFCNINVIMLNRSLSTFSVTSLSFSSHFNMLMWRKRFYTYTIKSVIKICFTIRTKSLLSKWLPCFPSNLLCIKRLDITSAGGIPPVERLHSSNPSSTNGFVHTDINISWIDLISSSSLFMREMERSGWLNLLPKLCVIWRKYRTQEAR